MDVQTAHTRGAGPYISTMNIINSKLSDKFEFKLINYKNELGAGISIKRILNLASQIKQIKPDILHFGGLQLSGFHIIIAAMIAGVKCRIITIHGFAGDNIEMNPFKKLILKYLIEPFTLLYSTKIVGVSNYVINRRQVKIFKRKIFGVIYNFPPSFDNNIKSNLRDELGLDKKDILVVTVSRITKEKGMDILKDVITKLKNYEKLKFIIVGEGEYLNIMKHHLQKQIQKQQVFFLGFRNDIQNILTSCDMFLLPTLHETLSIALLEASVCGLPLIASDTGGVPEIVKNNINGYLIPVGDIDSFVEKIIILKDNEIVRLKMGKDATDKVTEIFSPQSIEEKLTMLYKSTDN